MLEGRFFSSRAVLVLAFLAASATFGTTTQGQSTAPRSTPKAGKRAPPKATPNVAPKAPQKAPPEAPSVTAPVSPESSEASTLDAAPSERTPAPDETDGGRASPLNPRIDEMVGAADAAAPVDYDRLMADVAALRARVAAVSDNLYRSRISVALQTTGDHARLGRLRVSLDDGVVFTAPTTFSPSEPVTIYEHAVAPGRHAVSVDIERNDDRDDAFRTTQTSRFTLDVLRDHSVHVHVRLTDDSTMGGDFSSDKSGRYDLRFRVQTVAKPVTR